MKSKISSSVVAQAQPGPKQWFIWDSEVNGFGLLVSPGGTKSYVLQYRAGKARTRRLCRVTIGKHGSPWTPDMARREAIRLLGEVVEGRDPARERHDLRRAPTVADLIDQYNQELLGVEPKHRKTRMHLAWFRKEIGTMPLADVTGPLIARCRDKLGREITYRKRTRGPGTVNRYLASISIALTHAARDWGWIQRNPLLGKTLKRAKEPRGRVRFLSENERGQLLDECKESRNRNLFPITVLAISTGMRAGEIIGLRWNDVDLENGWITLQQTKNGVRRGVPLVGYALEVIEEHSKVRRLGSDLVFPSATGKANFPREAWEKALVRANIKDYRFHDNRHSAASYLAMAGVPLRTIADVLGHRTLAMVQRYSHLTDEYKSEAIAAMNKKIFGEHTQ